MVKENWSGRCAYRGGGFVALVRGKCKSKKTREQEKQGKRYGYGLAPGRFRRTVPAVDRAPVGGRVSVGLVFAGMVPLQRTVPGGGLREGGTSFEPGRLAKTPFITSGIFDMSWRKQFC